MGKYDNLDDAAAAALYMLGRVGDPKSEAIGGIYSAAGELGRTDPASSGQSAHVKGTITKPSDSVWAALFHNHPPAGRGTEASAERFSSDDEAQARRLGIPSYISTPSGAIRRFDPSTSKVSEVLAAFPWDDLKGSLMQKMGRAPDDPRGLRL